MATSRSKRAQERSDASKRLIIDAAVDVIAQNGIGKSTLKIIAERAGVSSALVVFHFKSKDNLMRIVLNELNAIFAAGWKQSTESEGSPASKRLLDAITFDLEFPKHHPKCLAVWYAFWGEAKGGLLYKGIGGAGDDRCRKDIQRLVTEIVEDGNYKNIDCRLVAETIYVMSFGYWHVAHNEADRCDFEFARQTYLDYLSSRFPNEVWS